MSKAKPRVGFIARTGWGNDGTFTWAKIEFVPHGNSAKILSVLETNDPPISGVGDRKRCAASHFAVIVRATDVHDTLAGALEARVSEAQDSVEALREQVARRELVIAALTDNISHALAGTEQKGVESAPVEEA